MDSIQVIRMALGECLDELKRALDGLNDEERRYQPAAHANHVDFIVWHMARVEDDWVARFAHGVPTAWERDGWHEKLGLPARDSGYGYDSRQVARLPRFALADLMAYYDAVRRQTVHYLDGLRDEDLDVCPQPERRPGYSVGQMLAHVVVEESQHVGHVAYLRGVQRGLGG